MSLTSRLVDNSYWLRERLGQGGMASVYRAHYRLSGEAVALKVVLTERQEAGEVDPDDGFRLRLALLREFQTLSSLHHPNIVDVLSYGLDEGRDPYFTMELLEQPLDIVTAAYGQPLARQVDLLVQLLRALTYVHRRGLLHRDIKPSNVLCVGSQVKVLDFGIAVASGQAEGAAGTIDYMAPELLQGQPPSVASDLYAVGILAHQMFTGQFPHNRASRTSFLNSLFNTNSDITIDRGVADLISSYSQTFSEGEKPLSRERAATACGVEGPVGQVIERLLARDPQARYGSAAEVVHALAAALGESITLETVATRESFLQANELIGRERELQSLKERLSAALGQQGSSILLGGESGVGKSRLLAEIRTLAMVSGAIVAQGQAITEGGSYLQIWLPILRTLCLHVQLGDDELSVLKELLPDLPAIVERVIPDAPKVAPELAEKRLSAVIESLFLRPTRPLVILLEDLHWAEPDSLGLLNRLSRLASSRRLLLIGTYRDDESPELPQRLSDMAVIRLARLDRDAISQLSVSMLGEAGKQPWVIEYLQRHTEGNVFFLVEVARALSGQGDLSQLGEAAALPDQLMTLGIGRIVERRLEQVPDSYRAVLKGAAIIGRKLDTAALQQLFPALDLRSFLRDCANAAILDTADGEWRFAHDKLREGLLEQLGAAQRRELHGRVAVVLEGLYSDWEPAAGALAYHFREAGVPDKARTYALRAGETATRLCAYNDARRYFAEALSALQELPPSAEIKRQRVDTLLKQVRASHIADRPKQNVARLDEAEGLLRSLAATPEQPADVLRLAWVYYWRGRLHYYSNESRESLRYHEEVRTIAATHQHKELWTLASSAAGTALFGQGRLNLSLPLIISTLDTYAQMGYGYEWVRAIGHRGFCLIGMGHVQRGMAEVERAYARAQEIDKPIILAMTHMYFCLATSHSGDWPIMLERGQKTLLLARQCGEKIYQFMALGYIAWAESELGHPAAALTHYEEAQAISHEMGGQLLFAILYAAIHANIVLALGRTEDAIQLAQQVIADAHADDNFHALAIAERVLAVALHRQGASQATVERHMQASLQASAAGWMVLDAARTRLVWAGLARERGDLVLARRLLDDATVQFLASEASYALAVAQELDQAWGLPFRPIPTGAAAADLPLLRHTSSAD